MAGILSRIGDVLRRRLSSLDGIGTYTAKIVSPVIETFSMGLARMRLQPNIYTHQEDLTQNTALFFSVPYIWAGINARAVYSLGREFNFIVGIEDDKTTKEERYMEMLSLKFGFKKLFYKTAIHLDVYGNCYWYISRWDDGEIKNIKIIQPERVGIKLDKYGNIEKYIVEYPNYSNKTATTSKTYEVDPEHMLHFTEREFLEIPFGISILQPIMNEGESRMRINILMPIIYQKYAKPWLHIKYQQEPNEPANSVKQKIRAFKEAIQRAELDSDLVTNHKWQVQPLSANMPQQPQQFLDDLDRQIFNVLEIPEFFFKPRGTTDLNVSEASRHFMLRMKQRQEHFADQFTSKFIVPEIQRKFGADADIPVLKFEEYVDKEKFAKNVMEFMQRNLIDKTTAKKMLGLEDNVG